MNRATAKRLATAGGYTFGELRGLIASARGARPRSRVNPAFPLEAVLDMFVRAIANRGDNEVATSTRYDCVRGVVRTGESLIVQNILRECATPEPGR
jgi:hypothetical protein